MLRCSSIAVRITLTTGEEINPDTTIPTCAAWLRGK